jgi:acetyl esterase/lipase
MLKLHGGGWMTGDKEDCAWKTMKTFMDKGFVIAAPDYPKLGVNAYHEIIACIVDVADKLKNYFAPGARVVAWGPSAGFQLIVQAVSTLAARVCH